MNKSIELVQQLSPEDKTLFLLRKLGQVYGRSEYTVIPGDIIAIAQRSPQRVEAFQKGLTEKTTP